MTTTQIKVTGMTCQHCVRSVHKALEKVPGVKSVEVSLEHSRATVAGDADGGALVAAVKEEGYQAELTA
ncbi:MAG: cation transporter [Burkholderiales bacterium]|nr:cation transporter [Burkholderiales bacterium]